MEPAPPAAAVPIYAAAPTPAAPTLTAPSRAERASRAASTHAAPARPGRDWARDAACDGADPALFDPVNRHVAARATALCATCPVVRACLLEALLDEQDTAYGPWLVRGGMTAKERGQLLGPARAALVRDLRTPVAPTLAPAA
jgi:hypothetical protein